MKQRQVVGWIWHAGRYLSTTTLEQKNVYFSE